MEEELSTQQVYKKDHNKKRRQSYYTGENPTYDEIYRFVSQEKLPSIKSDAKTRNKGNGILFDINAYQVSEIWKMQEGRCCYCKKIMTLIANDNHKSQCLTNLSVERYDSNRGYVFDNVLLCCTSCNRSKGESSHADWVYSMQVIANNVSSVEELKVRKQQWFQNYKTDPGPMFN